jgi:hypothetical protein
MYIGGMENLSSQISLCAGAISLSPLEPPKKHFINYYMLSEFLFLTQFIPNGSDGFSIKE